MDVLRLGAAKTGVPLVATNKMENTTPNPARDILSEYASVCHELGLLRHEQLGEIELCQEALGWLTQAILEEQLPDEMDIQAILEDASAALHHRPSRSDDKAEMASRAKDAILDGLEVEFI